MFFMVRYETRGVPKVASGASREAASSTPRTRPSARTKEKKKSNENRNGKARKQDPPESDNAAKRPDAAGKKRKRVCDGGSDLPEGDRSRLRVGAARGVPRMAGYVVQRRRAEHARDQNPGILSVGFEDDL